MEPFLSLPIQRSLSDILELYYVSHQPRQASADCTALNKLAAELGTMEDIHAIGALNDRVSGLVEANMMQCKISDFFKTI